MLPPMPPVSSAYGNAPMPQQPQPQSYNNNGGQQQQQPFMPNQYQGEPNKQYVGMAPPTIPNGHPPQSGPMMQTGANMPYGQQQQHQQHQQPSGTSNPQGLYGTQQPPAPMGATQNGLPPPPPSQPQRTNNAAFPGVSSNEPMVGGAPAPPRPDNSNSMDGQMMPPQQQQHMSQQQQQYMPQHQHMSQQQQHFTPPRPTMPGAPADGMPPPPPAQPPSTTMGGYGSGAPPPGSYGGPPATMSQPQPPQPPSMMSGPTTYGGGSAPATTMSQQPQPPQPPQPPAMMSSTTYGGVAMGPSPPTMSMPPQPPAMMPPATYGAGATMPPPPQQQQQMGGSAPGPGYGMVPPAYGPGPGMGVGQPPHPPQPMMGPATMSQQKPRLDPSLMPSAVQVIDEDRSIRSGPFPTGYPTAEFPPLTSTDYFAQDQGNCNPKFMRSTLYVAPGSSDILKNTQIPFAVTIAPFAPLHPNEIRPPVVDLMDLGPVRCHRCKAYMCPFMEFQDGGRHFKCPFCLASTKVEEQYFAHLDHNGRRTDIQQRPEQYLGSYEFVATKPYCKNGVRPKQPAFIFMLDVSYTSVHCGLVSLFCKNIRRLLDQLPRDIDEERSSIRIGFATYDQTIHFYNLRNSMDQPQMMVVSDINDVFVPFVDGFLVAIDEAQIAIQILLTEIETMFANTRITETMLGPAIEAGLDALKCADRCGKLFVFHTNLPLMEAPGKLKNRDDRKLLGTDKERTVLQPAIDYYVKLGEECVKSGCAVDLYLFPNSFVDIASLSPICTITGGSLYKYHYFEAEKDGERFLADLEHDISREIVFDCMMRVRTSTGLRPTGFFGSFFMDNSTDMEFGAIDSDKAVHVEIRHDDRLPEGDAFIQSASLFTSCSGQRRLRIHNMALPVSNDYNQLYRVTDSNCLVSFLYKQGENMVREKPPKDVREMVTSRCAQMLATYREKCSEQAPLGQLILPECLKLLPLYGNCIIRNDAISGGSDITVDDRAWMMQLVPSMRAEDIMLLLYPIVFPINDLVVDQPSDELIYPPSVRASYENFNSEKAYIIYNGLMMFIWIGLGVPQQWVQDVFNSNSVTQLNTEIQTIAERDNASSRGVRRLLESINEKRSRHMKLFVIRQQDALEAWMKRFLVEDRSSNMPSYVDYLCNIHREIRN